MFGSSLNRYGGKKLWTAKVCADLKLNTLLVVKDVNNENKSDVLFRIFAEVII